MEGTKARYNGTIINVPGLNTQLLDCVYEIIANLKVH